MAIEDLAARVGDSFGPSRWFTLDQARIDGFADLTEDWQPIHLDPRQANDAGFPGTVAHGFLSLSMLSAMAYDVLPEWPGMRASVNYGFDRLRFVAPVPSGARVRARFALEDVSPKGAVAALARLGVSVQIEDAERPALVATWLVLYTFDAATPG